MENEFEFVEHNPGVDIESATRGYEACEVACHYPDYECQIQLGDPVRQNSIQTIRQNNFYWG